MKQFLIVVLLVALSVIKANGQVGPVFPYTSPSKEALKSLAKQETAKGETYRNYLVKIINVGLRDTTLRIDTRNIDWVFNHLFLEEVNLEEGMFKNSGYNPTTNEMHVSSGHKLGWGFQWVFRIGTFTIVIIKGDCGNILEVSVIRTKVEIPQNNPAPDNGFRKTNVDELDYTSSVIIKEKREETPSLGNLNSNPPKKERRVIKIRVGHVVITIAVVAIVVEAVHLILHKKDSGGPGGAQKTNDPPPVVVPPVIIPPVVDPGGPGGAPKTP